MRENENDGDVKSNNAPSSPEKKARMGSDDHSKENKAAGYKKKTDVVTIKPEPIEGVLDGGEKETEESKADGSVVSTKAPSSPEKKARKGSDDHSKKTKAEGRNEKADVVTTNAEPVEGALDSEEKDNRSDPEVFTTPLVTKKVKEKNISPKTQEKRTSKVKELKGRIKISENVRKVYRTIHKLTGGIGGNGSDGAIYGELTMHSMQKVVNLMKEYTNLEANSMFLDIGSGLGKPNFHVAQDPGVKISYGIELEDIRWKLSIHNLSGVIRELKSDLKVNLRVFFSSGDITKVKTFRPFTHVYSCDIGFPPDTFKAMAKLFNTTKCCKYYISYQPPRLVNDRYGFDVDFLTKAPIKLTGSGEQHQVYLYKKAVSVDRAEEKARSIPKPDDQFSKGISLLLDDDVEEIEKFVQSLKGDFLESGRPVRSVRTKKLN